MDLRTASRGRVAGTAAFTPGPGGLHYAERGRLVFAGYSGEAVQRYWFALDGPVAEVCFTDGRPFHRLDLSSGAATAVHACPPDLYRGRFRVADWDCWGWGWRIEGPRKRMLIRTVLTRSLNPRG